MVKPYISPPAVCAKEKPNHENTHGEHTARAASEREHVSRREAALGRRTAAAATVYDDPWCKHNNNRAEAQQQ